MTNEPLPGLNRLVWIDLGDEHGMHPARVEDVTELAYRLDAPSYAGDLTLPPAGTEVKMGWTGERGLFVAPAEFVAMDRDEGIRLWRLLVTGEVRAEQRRRFARVAADGPVRIDGPGGVLSARMLDLGEGGVRCELAGSALNVGDKVSLRVGFDERLTSLSGHVLRRAPASKGHYEVVIVFDEGDQAAADAIRRFVLQQQLAERRAARA